MFLLKGAHLSHKSKLELYGHGPWIDEVDEMLFNHAGITCEIFRHTDGFFIGLAKLPEEHPWVTYPFSKVSAEVHGNLFIIKTKDCTRIGFSCDMKNDIIPRKQKTRLTQQLADAFKDDPNAYYIYRNLDFVSEQCRYLAEQVIEAHEPPFHSKLVYKHEE